MTNMSYLQKGYDVGCCDYIRKPFDLLELQLRIEQVIKSCYHNNESILILAEDLYYDTSNFSLLYKGDKVSLSKTEHSLLEVLLKYKNQVVSIETFCDEIWEEYVDPANIRVQVNNLRKKVPVEFIENRRGIGYVIPMKD
jgi:two-component system, OmpR family, response regulator